VNAFLLWLWLMKAQTTASQVGNALICAAAIISMTVRAGYPSAVANVERYTNFATAYGLILLGWGWLLWLLQPT
jgi:hypothetical protein